MEVVPTEKIPAGPAVESPLSDGEDNEDSSDEFIDEEPAPSAEEMAAYLGATGSFVETGSGTKASDQSLPTLEEAAAIVPAKAKALMEELFRARLEKVKRIDPKEIR